jgi:hypothetical protein
VNKDSAWGALVAITVGSILALAIKIAVAFHDEDIQADCDKFGKIRFDGIVYTCSKVTLP